MDMSHRVSRHALLKSDLSFEEPESGASENKTAIYLQKKWSIFWRLKDLRMRLGFSVDLREFLGSPAYLLSLYRL
jgi:hypothetical protein